ncbi:MAG: S46 family peptidase [Bacteroidia bacterium]
MKKVIFLMLVTGLLFSFKNTSDEEGMFTMSDLSKLDLAKAGLEIPVDAIYNENKPALVNALVRLGGCTGSFISETGLIITNHHCVFSQVAAASSSENNYLENGFYAENEGNEIKTSLPCKITQSYTDVSARVLEGTVAGMDALERKETIKKNIAEIEDQEQNKNPKLLVEISEMLVGKKYTLFRYKTLDDVRLVYVPPKNIGKFGGETDNWEWPRHNADFSVVRAYENGIPYTPEAYLEVNPSGTKEGDFAFILGYPGRTYRNQTAQFLDYQNNYVLPIIADWFDYQIDATNTFTGDDVDLQLAYSGRLASLNNTAKNFKGKMQGLQRTDVIAQTYKDQEYLEQYALRNPSLASYVPLFEENKKLYDRKFELSTDYLYLNQLYRNGIFSGGAYIALYADRAAQSKDSKAYISENKAAIIKTMGAYRSVVNKESLEKNLFAELYYRLSQSNLQEVREVFLLPVMGQDKAGIKAYANELWEDSKMQNVAKNDSLLHQKTAKFLKTKDKLVKLGSDVNAIFSSMQTEMTQINAEIDAIIPRFNDLEMELNEGKFIPDANGTLRFTYGYIKGYEPEDAVILEPFTTIQGIIEKAEGTDNPDYYLQQEYIDKMKEIEPADVLKHPENGEVVAGLLYNMDTTGGNSGSPIMDSKGRIVGVNFDRAYTATINDYAWNESYSRSIGVDIRYVLYVMKYFGGANKVLGEMGVEL